MLKTVLSLASGGPFLLVPQSLLHDPNSLIAFLASRHKTTQAYLSCSISEISHLSNQPEFSLIFNFFNWKIVFRGQLCTLRVFITTRLVIASRQNQKIHILREKYIVPLSNSDLRLSETSLIPVNTFPHTLKIVIPNAINIICFILKYIGFQIAISILLLTVSLINAIQYFFAVLAILRLHPIRETQSKYL